MSSGWQMAAVHGFEVASLQVALIALCYRAAVALTCSIIAFTSSYSKFCCTRKGREEHEAGRQKQSVSDRAEDTAARTGRREAVGRNNGVLPDRACIVFLLHGEECRVRAE